MVLYRSCPLSPRVDLDPLQSTFLKKRTWECKIKAFSLNSKFLVKPEWVNPGGFCMKSNWNYSLWNGSKMDQLVLRILQHILGST